jgi:hypothetical protein
MSDRTLATAALVLVFCISAAALVLGALSYASLHRGNRVDIFVQSGAFSSDEIDAAMAAAAAASERSGGGSGARVEASDFGGLGGVLGGGALGANRAVAQSGVRLVNSAGWEIAKFDLGPVVVGTKPDVLNSLQVHITQSPKVGCDFGVFQGHPTTLTFDLSVELRATKDEPGPVSVAFNADPRAIPSSLNVALSQMSFPSGAVEQADELTPVRADVSISSSKTELSGLPSGLGSILRSNAYAKVTLSPVDVASSAKKGDVVVLRAHGGTSNYQAVGGLSIGLLGK